MHDTNNVLVIFVVISVLLFILLAIGMLLLIDHKARIPDGFHSDPFSIGGLRREHPLISFITTSTLALVIIVLLLEVGVTIAERFGLFPEEVKAEIVLDLSEQRFSERQRHFHNVPVDDAVNLGKKQACFYCHGDYPHSKTRMIRTLLNMHTQFVGCMTCHTDEKKIPEESYQFAWLNFSGIQVKGKPYGTSIDAETGFLTETDDLYSKIIIYADVDGERTLMEATEEKPEVKAFLEIRNQLSLNDQQAMKKRIHKLVRRKGRWCTRCHAAEDDSYLPFRELGFSDQRVFDVTNLNIVGIIKKYKDFYLPTLFKKESADGQKAESTQAAVEQPVAPRVQ